MSELEEYVSAELKRQLDAEVVEKMRAELQGVLDNIGEFANLTPENQIKNRFLIEYCDTATAELIPLSLNYDQALFISTAAMAYRLFVLFALYKLDQDPGHIVSARPRMDEFFKETLAIREKVSARLAPEAHFSGQCQPIIQHHTGAPCVITKDGVEVVRFTRSRGGDDGPAIKREIAKALIAFGGDLKKKQAEFVLLQTRR